MVCTYIMWRSGLHESNLVTLCPQLRTLLTASGPHTKNGLNNGDGQSYHPSTRRNNVLQREYHHAACAHVLQLPIYGAVRKTSPTWAAARTMTSSCYMWLVQAAVIIFRFRAFARGFPKRVRPASCAPPPVPSRHLT